MQTAVDRAQTVHVLQVEGDEEQSAHEGEGHQHHQDHTRGERDGPEHRQRDQGFPDALLDEGEADEQGHGGHQEADRLGVAPAPLRTLDERPDQAEHRRGQQRDAGDVEGARRVLGAVVLEDQHAQDEGDHADRHVDEEDGLPAHVLDEHAAEDRTARGRGADHHAPDADRHVQLLGREGGAQQAERGRHQQSAEEALQHPERDHQDHAAGEADGARCRGEADDAYEEGLTVAEPVTELARGDQRDGEGEHVAVGDPLDVGERGTEVLLDRGVGDRDDRAVERDHHHADGHGEERQPGVAAQALGGWGAERVLGFPRRLLDGGLTSHTRRLVSVTDS